MDRRARDRKTASSRERIEGLITGFLEAQIAETKRHNSVFCRLRYQADHDAGNGASRNRAKGVGLARLTGAVGGVLLGSSREAKDFATLTLW